MKPKLLFLGVSFFSLPLLTQGQTLTKNVRNDFCQNAKYNYFYGTNSFFALMNISLKKIGITDPYKMTEAVKNICNNTILQDTFFENVHEISRGLDKQQYLSIGMNSQNAQILTEYMSNKNNTTYQPIQKKSDNKTSFEDTDDDHVEITKVISQKDKLKKYLPKKLTNINQLFTNSNFIERLNNLVGKENFNFIKNVCTKEIFITDDSLYWTITGDKEAGFNKKNNDGYIIAIDPRKQTFFVGINRNNKKTLYGEEKVFPNEIYQWNLLSN
ncbi:hypothetical protein HZQ97_07870 [Elizabethkingia anophelis]|uniref:hypothetical protein n=1 Tax=Elizabethkingia TaxID=308865 RepID=UPI0021A7DFF0|nr:MULTISPECIES: hypothetical protein [unclassified Elizabethkingia]MCT3644061.1 hypothetical protein [Elizabethkingia anophelis]MCT3676944.1 hypothetical protein [Elizabethkingia anophelis]MCT3684379.1 hypothetical protein [Elizabethkingia anophelis]MDX8560025.1 hypothetical protein [Elizabethkingia sp. HX ZCH]MDX8578607.1 hypothetical protein [Elizabethkingia sp. HX YK]